MSDDGEKMLELFTEWGVLAAKAEHGEPIEKSTVERLLDDDGPIPEIAKPLIKGIITGRVKFKRKPSPYGEAFRDRAVFDFLIIKDGLAYGSLDDLRNGFESPREQALYLVSERYGIEARTLEKWVKEFSER